MSNVPERRWLVLSYFSNIDGMACAQHIDDRIPILAKAGIAPILLTGVCGDRREGIVHEQVLSVAPSGLRFEGRHMIRKRRLSHSMTKACGLLLSLPLLPFYLFEKLLLDLDSQWSWFPLAAARGKSLCLKYGPEIAYSTGGPASAHVAAALIARKAGIPWIAEVQDPLVHGDWQRSRAALAVYRRVERFICRRADAVVFVTDVARERADRRTGLGRRGWTIYPGADLGVLPGPQYRKGPLCRFAHFGSLAGSRNITVFLDALGRLFREDPELVGIVRLDLYGTGDRGVHERIRAFPHPGIITDHGRLARKEAQAAMRQSDVLLLIQNTSDFSSETIPSKTYEYLQAGRPILGLVHNNPELDGMLRSKGHLPVDTADAGAVKESVAACLRIWEEGGATPASSPYTVESAVGKILEIADILLARRGGGDAVA
ncbi:MAG: glycosyltransferase [Candidatus Deferrimicrobiota bacterium]